MIAANELRIGNHALYFGKLLIVQLEDLQHLDFSKVEGIYLTPEKLERIGFLPSSDFQFMEIEICNTEALKIGFSLDDNDECEYKTYRRQMEKPINGRVVISIFDSVDKYNLSHQFYWLNYELKYLHQLQNLYFALTGEELKIDL